MAILFSNSELLTLSAQIVSAYVAANKVPAADVPALINAVYGALIHADAPKVQPQQPAVPIKQSISSASTSSALRTGPSFS